MSDNELTPEAEPVAGSEELPPSPPAVEPTPEPEQKRSRGGQRGNSNRQGHGVRTFLRSSALPKGAEYIQRKEQAFRRAVEHEVSKGGTKRLGLGKIALVDAVIKHDTVLELLQRWLRVEENLSVTDRLNIMDKISKSTDSRNRALEKLGVIVDPKGKKQSIFDRLLEQNAEEAANKE